MKSWSHEGIQAWTHILHFLNLKFYGSAKKGEKKADKKSQSYFVVRFFFSHSSPAPII